MITTQAGFFAFTSASDSGEEVLSKTLFHTSAAPHQVWS
jgi:hypothetical protein